MNAARDRVSLAAVSGYCIVLMLGAGGCASNSAAPQTPPHGPNNGPPSSMARAAPAIPAGPSSRQREPDSGSADAAAPPALPASLMMVTLHDNGSYLEAIAAANHVINKKGPDMAKAYYIRGSAEGQMKEFGLAVQDLREATKRSPSNGQSWFLRAWYEYENGEIDQAIKSGDRATTLQTESSMGWFNLGLCYAVRNDTAKSHAAYERALDIDKRGELSEALNDVSNAMERYPRSNATLKQALKWLGG